MTRSSEPLLRVSGLGVSFPVRGTFPPRRFEAVRNVDLEVAEGRTLGLVGESGSGKTTVARAIVGLTALSAGSIRLNGADLAGASRSTWRRFRREIQMVLQDPYGSLNPNMSARDLVIEAWRTQRGVVDRREWRQRSEDLLQRVGIRPDQMARRPRQFSGGQRQRIGIARALALSPRLLVCDEPTSALDVSIQAQVLNLLRDLQRERNLAVLFISHDLGVVRQVADEVAVMYRGEIVEHGPVDRIFDDPQHEYTRRLLAAVPNLESATHRMPGSGRADSTEASGRTS